MSSSSQFQTLLIILVFTNNVFSNWVSQNAEAFRMAIVTVIFIVSLTLITRLSVQARVGKFKEGETYKMTLCVCVL